MGKILIVDDDEMMSKTLSRIFTSAGHDAAYALTLEQGLQWVSSTECDVVFLDVHMPDGSGLAALSKIKESPGQPEVIIITAAGDADGAELAVKCGAWDYIEKSPSIKDLLLPLSRVFQYRKEKRSKKPPMVLKREKLIGNSPKIKRCLELLAQAAACNANCLITGETGTGKELFARAIHDNSQRADGSFVVVDCASLPKTLVESVLFGHKKGAFTGADRDQVGLVEQADGGTLFLDEVGELPMELQKRFLRVLQERSFRPVGGKKEQTSDFRLVAATNKDLVQMVQEGAFREDLLYRLRSLSVELPPLRERSEDVIELVRFHIARLCDLYQLPTKGFAPDFFDALFSFDWPGNVRELVNTLDGAVALAGNDPTLFCKHLPIHMRVRMAREAVGKKDASMEGSSFLTLGEGQLPKLKDFRDTSEKQYLRQLIQSTQRDLEQASHISGVSRSRLYELLNKHQLCFSNAVDSPHTP